MKKILAFIMFLTSVFACSSCRENPNPGEDLITLNSPLVTIQCESNDVKLAYNPADEKDVRTKLTSDNVRLDQTSPTYLFAEENGKQLAEVAKVYNNEIYGNYVIEKVHSYSFYLLNTNSNKQDSTAKLKLDIVKDEDNQSAAVRVMTYYEMGDNQYFKVYQEVDTDSNGNPIDFKYAAYDTVEAKNALIKFPKDASIVFSNEEVVISGNYLKYTILFWLEGDDPDCNEAMLSKRIKFKLTIE